jgi:hypothetical protein
MVPFRGLGAPCVTGAMLPLESFLHCSSLVLGAAAKVKPTIPPVSPGASVGAVTDISEFLK